MNAVHPAFDPFLEWIAPQPCACSTTAPEDCPGPARCPMQPGEASLIISAVNGVRNSFPELSFNDALVRLAEISEWGVM